MHNGIDFCLSNRCRRRPCARDAGGALDDHAVAVEREKPGLSKAPVVDDTEFMTLEGSFSAVSKPNFASRYSFELKALAEIYTMHSFAQLYNIKFCQKLPFFAKFSKVQQIYVGFF